MGKYNAHKFQASWSENIHEEDPDLSLVPASLTLCSHPGNQLWAGNLTYWGNVFQWEINTLPNQNSKKVSLTILTRIWKNWFYIWLIKEPTIAQCGIFVWKGSACGAGLFLLPFQKHGLLSKKLDVFLIHYIETQMNMKAWILHMSVSLVAFPWYSSV